MTLVGRITGVVVAIFLMCGVASATQSGSGVGLKAGLNINKFTGRDNEGLGSSIGFHVGVALGRSTRDISVQPEFIYTLKGGTVKDLATRPELKLAYFEVPVLLKIRGPGGENASSFVLLGPALALNISSTLKGSVDGVTVKLDVTNAKSVVYGLVFGFEYRSGLRERRQAFFDVRYTVGLSNAYEDVADPGPYDLVDDFGNAPRIRNGVLSLSLGYEL